MVQMFGYGKSLRKEIKMRWNIENLTTQLIERHRLDEAWEKKKSRAKFEEDVEALLGRTSLRDMKGPKLAEVFGSFQGSDLSLEKHGGDIKRFAELCSEPEVFHRGILGFFLARTIANRLDPEMSSIVPPYRKAVRNPQPVRNP